MPRPTSRRFNVERLEDRCVPTASVVDLPQVQVDPSQASSSHLLVQFRPGYQPVALPGTTVGRSYDLVPGLYQIDLAGTTLDQALAGYRADPRVATAEPDFALTASWVPNDPRFGEQWYLRNPAKTAGTAADIRAADGWGTIVNAQRVPIAVMDSGIDYTHPDLYLNIWLNQGEIPASRRAKLTDVDRDGLITFRDLNNPINIGPGKITDLNGTGYIDAGDVLKPMTKDASGNDTGAGGWADGASQDKDKYVDDLVGWNPTKNNNNPFDDYGHGTHVAGTLGAVGNNGVGVAGVAWQAQLVAVKFLNSSGAGSIGWFIDGLEWALAKGIKISNNSWNDSGYTQILYDAVRNARAKGHIFVAAAGNQNRDADLNPAYPAGFNLDNIVSVAATDRNDNKASFSNYGKTSVDIAAPGVDVLSTNPNKAYGNRSGTSMATPQVTGVLALVWALRPEWTYQQVINWVLSTADRVPGLAGKLASGRLNAAAAVKVPPRNGPQPPLVRATPVTVAAAATSSTPRPSEYFTGFVASQAPGYVGDVLALLEGVKKGKDGPFTQALSNR
ncbi:MAG: S8 family peptidase [Gemmataceae bacterium]